MRNDSMEADIKKPRKNVYSFLFKKFAQVRYEYLNEIKIIWEIFTNVENDL
jgi:hypothetical protein